MKTCYLLILNGKNQQKFLEKYKNPETSNYEDSQVKLTFLHQRIKSLQKEFNKSLKIFKKNLEKNLKKKNFIKKLIDEKEILEDDNESLLDYKNMCIEDFFYVFYKNYDDEVKFGNILWKHKMKFINNEDIGDLEEFRKFAKNTEKQKEDNFSKVLSSNYKAEKNGKKTFKKTKA